MKTEIWQETPLHIASRYQRSDVARELLNAGADPNARDIFGRTSLHSAVAADAHSVIRLLLADPRTDLNAQMSNGATPLIIAARLDMHWTVLILLKRAVHVNAFDNKGN